MTERNIPRRSSIETEPRTLSFEQLRGAREAALCVLKTKPKEEAINIFTEGLKPVLSVGSMERMHAYSSNDHEESISSHDGHGFDLRSRLRDIVSAPF